MTAARRLMRRARAIPEAVPTILLVEASAFFGQHLATHLEQALAFQVIHAIDFDSAVEALDEGPFLAVISGVVLRGVPDWAFIDLAAERGETVLTLTSSFHEAMHEALQKHQVVDYFVKSERSVSELVVALRRLHKNPTRHVIIVDDDVTARHVMTHTLTRLGLNVYPASNGAEALALVDQLERTDLVITDCHMPVMDGFELTDRLRGRFDRDTLAIIGVSSTTSHHSARLIKLGTNDFIRKPFSAEELQVRVDTVLDTMDHLEAIKCIAYRDHLTTLYNRLYFFEHVPQKFKQSARPQLAMIDIDHFKAVNDTFGHAGGDVALVFMSSILREVLGPHGLIARFGGEEFCVYFDDLSPDEVADHLEHLRQRVEAHIVRFETHEIRFTISSGLASDRLETLALMINRADTLLYDAKTHGRNRLSRD